MVGVERGIPQRQRPVVPQTTAIAKRRIRRKAGRLQRGRARIVKTSARVGGAVSNGKAACNQVAVVVQTTACGRVIGVQRHIR